MSPEIAEIIEALSGATMIPGSFDKMFTKHLDRKRLAGEKLSDVSERHTYNLLKRYRKQIPETFNKFQHLCE